MRRLVRRWLRRWVARKLRPAAEALAARADRLVLRLIGAAV